MAEPTSVRLPTLRREASRHPAHMGLPPFRSFCRNIMGAGNNRSVPEGSMPPEVWKLIFGYLPELASDIYEQFFRQLVRTGRNPDRWYDVPILPIDKGNGKPKCQHDLLMDAHANSLLGSPGCGVRKWLLGRGTRQGDTTAGDVFMDVYHIPLQAYKTAIQDDELMLEFGNDVIDAAMTAYPDDIAELMVADSVEDLDDKAVIAQPFLKPSLAALVASWSLLRRKWS